MMVLGANMLRVGTDSNVCGTVFKCTVYTLTGKYKKNSYLAYSQRVVSCGITTHYTCSYALQ